MSLLKGKFLLSGSVTTIKIAGKAVTKAKLADDVVATLDSVPGIDTRLVSAESGLATVTSTVSTELSGVNLANGLVRTGAGNKIPNELLPSLAISNSNVVADLAARDALTGYEEGDLAIVLADPGRGTYIAMSDGSWQLLHSPTDVVVSVNGQTGTVVIEDAPGEVVEQYTLTADQITNGIVLGNPHAIPGTTLLITGGLVHLLGTDYTLTVNATTGESRILFVGDFAALLEVGDVMIIGYQYLL